jgi:cation diffusion facilitator CzcD-associated flavoprotein CzcO
MSANQLDVLIIGAAQVGLAMGHELKDSNLRFELVEGHNCIGDSWHDRL